VVVNEAGKSIARHASYRAANSYGDVVVHFSSIPAFCNYARSRRCTPLQQLEKIQNQFRCIDVQFVTGAKPWLIPLLIDENYQTSPALL
jgi:hypothetical protein